MEKIKQKYDSLSVYLNLTRAISIVLLFSYWVRTSGEALGMVLILGILIFSILRQYLPGESIIIFLEGLFVGGLSYLWPDISIAYCIPIFEGYLEKKTAWIIPGLIFVTFRGSINFIIIFVFIAGGFLGCILRVAKNERDYYKEESDIERRRRYEAENLNKEFLSLREEVFQMVELAERNRIAQQLHDDVGHELTGAVLGLQAFESIIEELELESYEKELFQKAKQRVDNSATVLRQTVHNMKPYVSLGVEDLRGIVEEFCDIPISLKVFGNTEKVPIHYWFLLKTALKEGLTNIIRHANTTNVKAQLDVTQNILRFSLENDGVIIAKNIANTYVNKYLDLNEGMGLRSLRQRTKSYGGNFSAAIIAGEDKFRLIIVLPLFEGGIS
ncbi:sensor histidine kinase [Alkalibaculum sp. M08DMB]|uniref:histidine kinase n=1 Tax=Alkalibaculum sporogenes TaxID=2655001 RepID=A0A6A7K7T0_9FIRM|nr:histidine kinase [Alkalibaculum sporogenes]MPW25455.1 sensor histidine kinase [Alkalibaculum sporogenes]